MQEHGELASAEVAAAARKKCKALKDAHRKREQKTRKAWDSLEGIMQADQVDGLAEALDKALRLGDADDHAGLVAAASERVDRLRAEAGAREAVMEKAAEDAWEGLSMATMCADLGAGSPEEMVAALETARRVGAGGRTSLSPEEVHFRPPSHFPVVMFCCECTHSNAKPKLFYGGVDGNA